MPLFVIARAVDIQEKAGRQKSPSRFHVDPHSPLLHGFMLCRDRHKGILAVENL
jgi:hypothetical protein